MLIDAQKAIIPTDTRFAIVSLAHCYRRRRHHLNAEPFHKEMKMMNCRSFSQTFPSYIEYTLRKLHHAPTHT